jgi:hypothetical protein
MADIQLQNSSRFLLYALGKQALSAFPEQNNWNNIERQIGKNLKEEIALYSAAPGVIWNPANPQYLFRNGCR